MKFLVTGANGFVGKALCTELLRRGEAVSAAVRSASSVVEGVESIVVGAIDGNTNWRSALSDVDVVIHLAARVHVMKDKAVDPLAEFLKVNLHGTENLARQAAQAGVKRFVYLSSIKVNGESTTGNQPYSESDQPNPQDPYGISKWRAEQALQRIAQETGLETVIVRSPLIYGPGVRGNFISLMNAIDKGLPLPLAGAQNLRSLLYVGNLVDALIACATHPAAAGQTYLLSDGEDVSTAMLVEKIAQAMGHKNRSFYFPPSLLLAVAGVLGKSAQVGRLFGSLQVSNQKICRELNWHPPFTLQQGLYSSAEWHSLRHISYNHRT
jgi:nucleoside-diphosphate-sugar epimerase